MATVALQSAFMADIIVTICSWLPLLKTRQLMDSLRPPLTIEKLSFELLRHLMLLVSEILKLAAHRRSLTRASI